MPTPLESAALDPSTAQMGEAIVRALLAACDPPPERVILFGSRAKGTWHRWSDVDLLVVRDQADWGRPGYLAETDRLQKALPPLEPAVDLLLYTPSQVARYSTWRQHVVTEALRTGVTLYERH